VKYAQSLKTTIPDDIFIIGKIGEKYPFKMGLTFKDYDYEVTIVGSYIYDSKPNNRIELKGYKQNNILEINEYVDGEITGHFTIKESTDDQENNTYKGKWTNADGTRTYDVDFIMCF